MVDKVKNTKTPNSAVTVNIFSALILALFPMFCVAEEVAMSPSPLYQNQTYGLLVIALLLIVSIYFLGRTRRLYSVLKEKSEALQITQFAIDKARDAVFWVNADAKIIYVNSSTCNMLGYSQQELLSMFVYDIDHNFTKASWSAHWQKIKQKGSFRVESTHHHKNGKIFPIEVSVNYFHYDGKEYNCAFVRDITKRRQEELALRESETLFLELTTNIHEVFWIGTPNWDKVIYVSPAYEKVWGRSCESLYAKPLDWLDAVVEEDHEKVIDTIKRISAGDLSDIVFPEYRIVQSNGSKRWIYARAFPVYDENGEVYRIAGTAEDITNRKQTEEKINTMAYHDYLTGLPNRALFFDRLGQTISHAQRTQKLMAVLILDLDRFKLINDELGHSLGDKALIEVSNRLQQCTRTTDTVARLGGDEFGIILVDVNSEEHTCKIAEDIIAAIREPLTLKESQYTLGVSIGICMVSSEDNDIKGIMRKADTAMYQGKKKGGNYVIVHE